VEHFYSALRNASNALRVLIILKHVWPMSLTIA